MPTDALINVNGESVQALEILLLTTIMMLLPSLIIMMTSFTRYVVVFSFLRSAMGTQQTPPNMVLVGMALILTLFTMSPTLSAINEEAFQPYQEEEITQEEFFQRAQVPLKRFMIRWTRVESMELYCNMSGTPIPETEEATQDLPLTVIIPAFITSELKQAFFIGFLLYIPFMLIDMVVASTLMSMGMVMLPPSMISTPFKLLLFILLDGWQLLFSTLVRGFGLG
ncbi:MAG: flagellar type III secretion system pore protein FliP [Lawsonibacter sp.]|jgi:flagellar biosynthetic protein FliP|nr:flagellar type III secretion system pore protein FliP [Lawsonibacter sp.]